MDKKSPKKIEQAFRKGIADACAKGVAEKLNEEFARVPARRMGEVKMGGQTEIGYRLGIVQPNVGRWVRKVKKQKLDWGRFWALLSANEIDLNELLPPMDVRVREGYINALDFVRHELKRIAPRAKRLDHSRFICVWKVMKSDDYRIAGNAIGDSSKRKAAMDRAVRKVIDSVFGPYDSERPDEDEINRLVTVWQSSLDICWDTLDQWWENYV